MSLSSITSICSFCTYSILPFKTDSKPPPQPPFRVRYSSVTMFKTCFLRGWSGMGRVCICNSGWYRTEILLTYLCDVGITGSCYYVRLTQALFFKNDFVFNYARVCVSACVKVLLEARGIGFPGLFRSSYEPWLLGAELRSPVPCKNSKSL